MLSMRSIHKDFSGVTVLDGVDFEVASGEIHALLGANGAGKSTLIKVLGGQYPDATGTTELDGAPVDLATPRRALLSGIGIVHQELDLIPELTVAENVFLGIERLERSRAVPIWRGIDRNGIVESTKAILARYRLELDPNAKVGTLTAGAQQLTVIARVLALESNVMIFDEPTARLGQRDKERLFEVFSTLRRDGKKVVFVTHYLDEVIAVADRASVMRDGRLLATRRVEETNVAELSQLMVGTDVRPADRRRGTAFGEPVLQVAGLSEGEAFADVALSVRAGEIVGLVGHLGSGRHELTRTLLARRADTGSIAISAGPSAGKVAVGFVPENRRSEGIFPDLPVAANIAIGVLRGRSLFAPLPRREIERVARDSVDKLQVKTDGIGQKIGELSGGNQQKVVFARSMVSEPVLYIIEAPTVGVDVKAAAQLHAQIFALAARGAGVLLATDDLDEAILLSDHVLVMLRGRVAADLEAQGLTRQRLVAAMGAA